MRLKKGISFEHLEKYLKSNSINNFTNFDQDNFFQINDFKKKICF